jgi:membrane protease YdiL (CAAX protease family)
MRSNIKSYKDIQMTIESQTPTDPITALPSTRKVNWKQVGTFIGLTFGLTWSLDLVLFLNGGLNNPAVTLVLQFQMLLPAFSAILLGMFFFRDSRINIKNNHSKFPRVDRSLRWGDLRGATRRDAVSNTSRPSERPSEGRRERGEQVHRWFTGYFLFFTLLYGAAVILAFIRPELLQTISSVMLIPGLVGLVLAIVLRAVGGKATFAGVGMGGGKPVLWFLFGLAIIAYAGLQTLLSWLFKMGQPVDLSSLYAQAALSGMTPPILMVVLAAQTIILGPFLGLLVTFGEEYGWRGYLQPTLTGLGRVRGVTLVGIIWGVWHWPVIWMGYNYPGHPFLGSLLMVLLSIGLAFMLGYAVLKAKGIWIAAFLHALVNQSFGFFMGVVYTPTDTAYSFGIGIPAFIIIALLVALILRDPIWKQNE